MAEEIEFRAMSKNYHLHIAPEHPYFDENRIARMIPAKVITFSQAGVFRTADPVVIAAIRSSTAFRAHRVIEISEGDKALFRPPEAQKTVRGSITASAIQQEAGISEQKDVAPQIKLAEQKGPACEVCGKVFENDPNGRKLRMHKVNHRVSRAPSE